MQSLRPVERSGTAQGSPLSPLLFSLVLEPFAIAIRQSSTIQGTVIGTTMHKILLYTDDILLTLTDTSNSIPELISCVKEFGQISGYKVHFTKSEIMPLGFTYLGVKITPKISQHYAENVNPMIKHIKARMVGLKRLPISFLGRINLIKMIILPKIIYPLSMLFISLKRNNIKNINKALSDFISAGRKPKIKLDVLQLPKEQGGWGLPNITNYITAMQARIISIWIMKSFDQHALLIKILRPVKKLHESGFCTIGS
uniref:Reverse transcriptase domain-containing protein n=1 Tax=Amphilophus citrinellus TaxID=61819 RepID=A0A3Q0T4M8_AMPCI